MSEITVPQAQKLIFCRRYEVDPIAKEINLRGVFHRLRFRSFSTEIVPFTVYSVLKDGLGEGEMRAALHGWVDGEVHELHQCSKWFHFPGKPDTIELEMQFRQLRFQFPGLYAIVVTFDGHLVARRFFEVEAIE